MQTLKDVARAERSKVIDIESLRARAIRARMSLGASGEAAY